MLIGIGGTILVLVVVFWFIFTFVIDPQVVVDAFLSLALWQLGVLGLMSAATYVLLGLTLQEHPARTWASRTRRWGCWHRWP